MTTVFATESTPGKLKAVRRGILLCVSHRPAVRARPDGVAELRGV